MSDQTNKTLNSLRYRIRNSCGQDGKILRIACLVVSAILLVVFGVVIAKATHDNKNETELPVTGVKQYNQRHPKNNGYEEFDWNQLSSPVQSAAQELGYNARLWNSGQISDSFEKDWADLSEREKNAASLLGWDEETWCTDYDDDNMSYSTSEPTSDASTSEPSSDASTSEPTSDGTDGDNYRDYDWDDLPPDVQVAAKKFGYDQNSWDKNMPTSAFRSDWDDLSADLKAAAIVLGYNEDSWCDEPSPSWLDQDWADLPDSISHVAGVLGYTEDTWNDDGQTSVTDRDWADLTDEQRIAAQTLGYDEDSWDNGDRRRRRGLRALRRRSRMLRGRQ